MGLCPQGPRENPAPLTALFLYEGLPKLLDGAGCPSVLQVNALAPCESTTYDVQKLMPSASESNKKLAYLQYPLPRNKFPVMRRVTAWTDLVQLQRKSNG